MIPDPGTVIPDYTLLIRYLTGLPYTVRSAQIIEQLGWSLLTEMRMQQKAIIMMYKTVDGLALPYIRNMFKDQLGSNVYNLRNSKLNLEIP